MVTHVPAGALSSDTTQTSGMTRFEAISGRSVGSEKLWMGETHVAPATSSGDHHHGEAETAIYVVSGRRSPPTARRTRPRTSPRSW